MKKSSIENSVIFIALLLLYMLTSVQQRKQHENFQGVNQQSEPIIQAKDASASSFGW